MIVSIRGVLLEKTPTHAVIDINGLGYEIEISLNTYEILPAIGESVTLLTHFIVREDAQLLFGFHDIAERELFRLLIKVNGVGPKLAMSILSSMKPSEFVKSILLNNEESIKQIPGVGKKTAERLRIEMKDKVKDWGNTYSTSLNCEPNLPMTSAKESDTIVSNQAIQALIALGYKSQEAARMVNKVLSKEINSLEEIIRQALRTTQIPV